MRNFKYLFAILGILLLGTLACESTPEQAAPEAIATGAVLFEDDFSNPNSGWDVYSDEISTNEYYEGEFRISVNQPGYYSWANPQLDLSDVHIEVETKSGGEEDNYFGVLCRYQPDGGFYAFVISSDGYYGVLKRIAEDDPILLGTSEMLESSVINTGEGSNTIQVDCVGNQLTLAVNGQTLADVVDGEFTSGDVGMIVATLTAENTVVSFDNFSVRAP
jgi:hypothetical protein